MPLSSHTTNMIKKLLIHSNWQPLSVFYGTKNEPEPGDGNFMQIRLASKGCKDGVIDCMIYENFNTIVAELNPDFDIDIDRINTDYYIGASMKVERDNYYIMRHDMKLLLD